MADRMGSTGPRLSHRTKSAAAALARFVRFSAISLQAPGALGRRLTRLVNDHFNPILSDKI